jgi:hypothetical protein
MGRKHPPRVAPNERRMAPSVLITVDIFSARLRSNEEYRVISMGDSGD